MKWYIATIRLANNHQFPHDAYNDLKEAIAYTNFIFMKKHGLMMGGLKTVVTYNTEYNCYYKIEIKPIQNWDGSTPKQIYLKGIAQYLLSRFPDKYKPFVTTKHGTRLFDIFFEEVY